MYSVDSELYYIKFRLFDKLLELDYDKLLSVFYNEIIIFFFKKRELQWAIITSMKASKFFNIQTNKIHVPTVHLKTKWGKKNVF